MQIGRKIDAFLNGITMYRLVLYSLLIMAAAGITNGYLGSISISGNGLILSLGILLAVSYATNRFFGRIWSVAANSESWFISALILFCILPPVTTKERAVAVGLTAVLAMSSKYLLAWRRKHIFNPSAFAVCIAGLLGLVHATWWIGSAAMLPFTLVLGLLIVRKMRRFYMFTAFGVAAILVLCLVALSNNSPLGNAVWQAIVSGPLIFLGTIMLTEPSTSPPRLSPQVVYGILVGVIFASQWHWGGISATPEVALLIGNIMAYIVSPKAKVRLRLIQKRQMSAQVYDFAFEPERPLNHQAGQYMEWTMPVPHADNRGNRRTFTVASSPTESTVHLGVKFYEPSSTFKKVLRTLELGAYIQGGQLAGSFTLPKDASRKLVFIAGGIGITPFRSMLKYCIDTKENRDIVLFYSVSKPEEVSYQDILKAAEVYGVRTIPVLGSDTIPPTWKGKTGFITNEMIQEAVPDYKQRLFYLSGPNVMVEHYRDVVRGMQVPRRQIKTDHFSGY